MATLEEIIGSLLTQLMPAYSALHNYEPLAQSYICSDPASFAQSLIPSVGAVILLSVALVVFFYLLSKIFASPQLESYTKIELQETFLTALIFIFFTLLIPIPCVPASLLGVPTEYGSNTLVLDGGVYLSEVGSNYLVLGYLFSTLMYYIIMLYSVVINAAPLVGVVIAPFQGLSAVIAPIFSTATTTLSTAIVINFAYLLFYDFMTYSFIKAFLPIGLILRSFTVTKKAGSAIIALCLSFYVLFPFILTLEHSIVINSGYGNGLIMVLRNLLTTVNSVKDLVTPGAPDLGDENYLEGGSSLFVEIGSSPLLASFGFNFLAILSFEPISKLIVPTVFKGFSIMVLIPINVVLGEMLITTSVYVFINSIIFPAINTLVLVGATSSFAQLLGLQLDVSSLTRLI